MLLEIRYGVNKLAAYKNFFNWISASLSIFASLPSIAYDNSKFPHFDMETPNRDYQFISIHPNNEDWLITEAGEKGHLLVYNLKTHCLQRYDVPGNYQYTFATFFPKGEMVAMIRSSFSSSSQLSDQLEKLATSEVAVMNRDGTDFQVLSIPKGIIVTLSISPDEKKIAYWVAKTIRDPGGKTLITDFDIREFDLTTKTERLFAGPFNFFGAGRINYFNDSTLLISGFAPKVIPVSIQEYSKKFNYSRIYEIYREQKEISPPIFTKNRDAHEPVLDSQKNFYLIDYPESSGMALTKISFDGKYFSWRAPDLKNNSFFRIAVSPSGKYLAFTYGDRKLAIGLFQFDQETWSPISIPPPNNALSIPVKPVG